MIENINLQRSKRHLSHHHQRHSRTSITPKHTESNSLVQLAQAPVHAQHIIHPAQATEHMGQQHVPLTPHPAIIPQNMQPSPQMLGSTFIDPSQYLAAIPVPSVLPSGFPATAAVISSIQVRRLFWHRLSLINHSFSTFSPCQSFCIQEL